MSEISRSKKHTLMLDNRSRLVITGAEDVNGFNEDAVSIKTADGTLVVKGSGLHIDKLNLDTGDVSVEGKVNALQYIGSASNSKLSKLFR